MRTINAPCHNCKDKKITKTYNCHSDCKRYNDYKEERKKTKTEAQTAMALADVEIRRADRVIKRKTGKRISDR